MDGNLLDSENADATLAKEWTLPELPPDKSSSLPSSSQELADIFGTGGGHSMDFPFGLNMDPELSLGASRETDFFLNSLNSLDSIPPVTSSSSSPLDPRKERAVGGGGVSHVSVPTAATRSGESPGVVATGARLQQGVVVRGESAAAVGTDIQVDTPGVKSENSVNKMASSYMSSSDQEEGSKSSGMTLRKSTRILRKSVPALPVKSTGVKKTPSAAAAASSAATVQDQQPRGPQEIRGAIKEGIKERLAEVPRQADTKEVQREAATAAGAGLEQGKELSSGRVRGSAGKKDEVAEEFEEEDDEEDGEDGDEDDESSDDPDRLWCICQQPHNDRFMICCDQCEEWYHGSCVGISVSQGKRMEREGKDYVCPVCVEKEKQEKEERDLSRSARIGRRDIVKENILKKKLGLPVAMQSEAVPPTEATAVAISSTAPPTKPPPAESSEPAVPLIDSKPPAKHASPQTTHVPPPMSSTPPPPPATSASSHSNTAVRRRVSSTYSHGDPSEDQYGLAQLFQPDNAPKPVPTPTLNTNTTAESVMPVSNTAREESTIKTQGNTFRTKFKEEYTGSCVAPECKNPTFPPSVYCSDDCLEKHVSHSLQMLEDRGISFQTNPQEFVRGSGGVSVLEMATSKMLVGIAAPSAKNLVSWLKKHPSYQVLLHRKGKGEKKKPKMKSEGKKESKKDSEELKMPKISLMDPASVRANAKRALYQILWKRCEDAADMSGLEQSKVEQIANDIEIKLFNLHGDINPKYKNKYRSLVFNLKDVKNQGLFRKVVLSEISAYELVRMSTEKLASEELAQWREKTIKKNLEMIKEREEEAGAMGKVIRKFTYKGEVEIDTADDITVEDVNTAANPEGDASSSTEDQPLAKPQSKTAPKPNSKPRSDSKSGAGGGEGGGGGGILHLLESTKEAPKIEDTTAMHGQHVYDQNCDICTGRNAPPPSVTPSSPPPPPPPPPPPLPPPENENVEEMSEGSSYSPLRDSTMMDTDSEDKRSSSEDPQESSMDHVVWKGFVNMSGLTKFATTAYPVAGPVQDLDLVLPDTLHVMGRIAHVQVWDYMDKLRSSTSRDIVVLRFSCIGDEEDSYMSMLTYLVKKHRCGVINCCFPEVKDMYLVPLQAGAAVASQLLPFKGPGLPPGHGDLLLGLIVRSRRQRQDMMSPQHTEKINVEVSLKRHHSGSFENLESRRPSKRSKLIIEVGVNGETPPRLTGFQDDIGYEDEGDIQDLTPTIPMMSEGSHYESPASSSRGSSRQRTLSGGDSNSQITPIAGPTSFFGSHQPLPVEPVKPTTGGAEGGQQAQNPLSTSGKSTSSTRGTLDSIFSQLSDEKLFNDLRSAVSKVTSKPQPTGSQNAHSSAALTSAANQVPDYGANTPPPPEELEPPHSHGERFPRVAGGPLFPQQGMQHVAAHPTRMDMGTGNQNQIGAPMQSAPPQEWNRDRERFANTPPPDYQPSFNFPQGANASSMTSQQPPQGAQYHGGNSTYQQNQPVDPRTSYNNYPQNQDQYRGQQQQQYSQQQQQQQQGGWDYGRQHGRGGGYDNRRSRGEEQNSKYPHEEGRGHERLSRGDRPGGRGNNYHRGNYGQQRRGRDFRHDKHYSSGVKGEHKYPAEWYRK